MVILMSMDSFRKGEFILCFFSLEVALYDRSKLANNFCFRLVVSTYLTRCLEFFGVEIWLKMSFFFCLEHHKLAFMETRYHRNLGRTSSMSHAIFFFKKLSLRKKIIRPKHEGCSRPVHKFFFLLNFLLILSFNILLIINWET